MVYLNAMKGEDKRPELRAEMLIKQDQHTAHLGQLIGLNTSLLESMQGMVLQQQATTQELAEHRKILEEHTPLLREQGQTLKQVVKVLTESTPKYDHVMEVESLPDNRIILHPYKPKKAA